ncbi:MAG: DUF262 domain-containing protein, partial [bacterium]
MSIVPQRMDINQVFSSSKYYIDFYQREYKWTKSHVDSLLDDIFYRFDLEYDKDKDPTEENIDKYAWYYLNSFMTNDYNGKTYIVDGQQRLTTLTLVLIKLYHKAKEFNNINFINVLEDKIFGSSISGKTFWMGQNGRKDILDNLLNENSINEDEIKDNISYKNMFNNYKNISDFIDSKIIENEHKFLCFTIYFLRKILLVKIHIDDHKDVAMVFEVINDRGEKLRPYEVFKGALLGQLDKDEIDRNYNYIWKKRIEPLEMIGDE